MDTVESTFFQIIKRKCSQLFLVVFPADIGMLKTALRNFVSNANKYTNTGGAIKINGVQIHSNITISVADNGIGIPSDNIAKLFEAGRVLSTKGTADENGTGIGLLLCKEFTGKHQGKILAESKVRAEGDFRSTLQFHPDRVSELLLFIFLIISFDLSFF